MKSVRTGLIVVTTLWLVQSDATVIAGVQNAAPAAVMLEAARQKEIVEGDLAAAIRQYEALVARYGKTNRPVAAEALARMADCYERQGSAKARETFERIVRDYADQKDVATRARARLGMTGAELIQVKGDRSVWVGRDADGFGTISPDGRFLTYTDWGNGAALGLRDLTLGTNYRLTSGGSTQFSVISKDGRQVVYDWYPDSATPGPRSGELRIANLHATGMSDSRLLFQNSDVTPVPYDWSPDGNWIAVSARRADGTGQIGLVSVRDGVLHVLKSLDWKSPEKIFFSPDSKYIAYDLQAADDRTERHVYVMPIDASFETPVVAHSSQNAIMGWSPDGRLVLFSSDRSGSVGLWSVSVRDGKPTAGPTLLKPDIASAWSIGLTAGGTMYVWKYASPIYVQAASIDPATGKLAPNGPGFQRFITSRGRPAWSADGKSVAFQSCNPLGAGPCTLWIRSMETGQLRELKPKLGYWNHVSWSPDGRELVTQGRDIKGRNPGPYRIDVHTGEATLVTPAFPAGGAQWSADGKHIYYRRDRAIVERDLASGTDRDVLQLPAGGNGLLGRFAVSPDSSSVAYLAAGPSDTLQLFVAPVTGGAPRSVFQVARPDGIDGAFHWTSNGRALALVKERADSSPAEFWILDVNGGSSRKLDVALDHWMTEDGYAIDRAGRQVVFVGSAGQPGLEIRALENFLPGAPTRK